MAAGDRNTDRSAITSELRAGSITRTSRDSSQQPDLFDFDDFRKTDTPYIYLKEGWAGIKLHDGTDIGGAPVVPAPSVPVGFVYMQLPGMDAPDTLFSGTWSNISASFAGAFFRIEGGDASAFGAGSQGNAIASHGHGASASAWGSGSFTGGVGTSSGAPQRPVYAYTNQALASLGVSLSLGASASVGAPNGTTVAGETRPLNYTVRIWQRVA